MDNSIQIRVLFIHHSSAIGGAELSLFDLVSNLSSEIEKFCAVPAGPLAEKLRSMQIPVDLVSLKPLHRSINPFYWLASLTGVLRAMFELKRICRRQKIQLIHANTFTAAIYAVPVSLICGIPMIWHERDLARHPLLVPLAAKFARAIIAISGAVAENLKDQMGETGKVRLIYNGINAEDFGNDGAVGCQIPGVAAGKKVVLMTGQFVPWKGHMTFIEMASIVAEKNHDAVFVLAGDRKRPDQQRYVRSLEEAIEERRLRDKFIWAGFSEEMPNLLKNVDCVVVPSIREPFGRVLVEAMAAGKPAVGVRAAAVPEIIENGVSGFLVEPGDSKAIAKTVLKLLDDKELSASIGEKGRLRVSQKFTIKRTAAEFESLAKELVLI